MPDWTAGEFRNTNITLFLLFLRSTWDWQPAVVAVIRELFVEFGERQVGCLFSAY